MTFEQFQATRRWSDNIRQEDGVDLDHGEPAPGFVYHEGDLYIFANPGGTEARIYDLAGGNAVEITAKDFDLVIGNWSAQSENLEELERELYAYGLSEGHFD
jgi:hypothetical protein